MPLMMLGLVFLIALFVFYLLSTSSNSSSEKKEKSSEEPDLKKEDNVIFLPSDLEKEKQKHKR